MTEVFIAIGSNLSDPLGQARRAVAALGRLPESVLVEASSFYSSRPMGPADQPDYVNAVARLNTRLAPLALLAALAVLLRRAWRRKHPKGGAAHRGQPGDLAAESPAAQTPAQTPANAAQPETDGRK